MSNLDGYRPFRWSAVSLLVLLFAVGPAWADRHYLLIFSAQTHPKIPRYTHTFCTIVKVAEPPPACFGVGLEVHTISWLPLTLNVKPYRFRAEPGYNLTLDETLNWSAAHKMRVSLWGPYAITECFYAQLYREYARFERGEYRYRAIDPPRRGDRRSDCIHAVTDVDGDHSRMRYLVLGSGDAVTRKFVRVLRDQGRLSLPSEDMSWLDAVLGLDRYGVCHRPNP